MSRKVSLEVDQRVNGARDSGSLYDRAGRRKYLNVTERSHALRAMQNLPPEKALFALTLAWTGARVSEVLALTPASFQVDQQLVTIRTLKRRCFAIREVPIPATLMAALESEFGLINLQQKADTAGKLLWRWHRSTAWRLVKSVTRTARISGPQSSPRGFRHGFGIGALRAKVPLNLVQRWLGHARMSTTAIYADASGPEELEFAARFWQSE